MCLKDFFTDTALFRCNCKHLFIIKFYSEIISKFITYLSSCTPVLASYRNDAVYFAAVGGAAALLALHIKEAEVIAFDDLGTEAIRRLVVEDFPVIVATDCHGNSLYSTQN